MANKNSAKTATQALVILWGEKFFFAAKSRSAVEQKLNTKGFNFSGPELGMALMRARYLTRKGKAGSYQYIQKHPFPDEELAPTKKGKR